MLSTTRRQAAIGYSRRTVEVVTAPAGVKLDVDIVIGERKEAEEQAQGERRGLRIFVDGSRLSSGASGCAVVWKDGDQWRDTRVHAGYNQEAYGTECMALVRTLEVAASRRTAPEAVTIFSDFQAAIGRMASSELGPGQKHAILAREWIAKLKGRKPDVQIEIRWCPGPLRNRGK